MAKPSPPPTTTTLSVAQYTTKDIILYALGIGCCCEVDENDHGEKLLDDELCYTFEKHESFRPFPTFPLTLSFTAGSVDGGVELGVRTFPPFAMRGEDGAGGVLPRRFIRQNADDDDCGDDYGMCPVIHVSQSLRLHEPIPIPMGIHNDDEEEMAVPYDPMACVSLSTRVVSVVPKRVGTFVTTETEHYNSMTDSRNQSNEGKLLFTSRSTVLVAGVPENAVRPYRSDDQSTLRPPSSLRELNDRRPQPDSVHRYRIAPNQALLYRLSGDYNPLHVDPSLSSISSGDNNVARRPILHGLCTLGFAVRAALRRGGKETVVRYVTCNFIKPVFVGDRIAVLIWDDEPGAVSRLLRFQVRNDETGHLVVDGGSIEVKSGPALSRL